VFGFPRRRDPNSQAGSPPSLLGDQKRLVPDAALIFDVGMHHGHTTKEYLDGFPAARVHGFEAEPGNLARAKALLERYGKRVELVPAAVSDVRGTATLNVNSDDGTHSLLEIGALEHWRGHAVTKQRIQVDCVALDGYCEESGISSIDILKIDIQGAELKALLGARRLLEARRIRLIAAEVEFQPLYKGQPLYEDVALWLRSVGYGLVGLYDLQVVGGTLSWADAIFVPKAA
jgi:FkbM family methyltransferase